LAQERRINGTKGPVVNLGKDVFCGNSKVGPVGDEGCEFFVAQSPRARIPLANAPGVLPEAS
jgi:hypothetical protein